MNRIAINGFQFFSLIILYELGSSVLIGIASSAKKDAWIATAIATLFGCLLCLIYFKLYQYYPTFTLTSFIPKIVGKQLGFLIGVCYIVYFIYMAARVLRDFEQLLIISLYPTISLMIMGICLIITVMYAGLKGFEVFSRVGELCFFIMIFIIVVVVSFQFISDLIKLDHLRPVLENGWKPIVKAIFPTTLTSPFGELITFTMIFPLVNSQRSVKNIGLSAIAVSGILISIFLLLEISVIGETEYKISTYPVLTAVSYINIAGFIQRLDSLVIVIMVLIGFIKIGILFFCAVSGTADLFKLKQANKLIYPIGCIILFCSLAMAPNQIIHYKEGLNFIPYYLHIPFQIIIPFLLLCIAFFRNKNERAVPKG
ncbi:GerAB/ArcD/ProY family transporter [Bacillus sp. RG28]|uniref:GerAB/ArcD/ProY family transporter n=1 Tax=Gottfriedia endophytica TaxID=2820819 RepID=A0A940NQN0_9BACI|nr:GerAB/ArcD/ProY family transporter [Gottfriedia endophytica]MBP0725096.1 GerAB/ArcD/ProY family transporter [Gottfriedia endophytica]